jgi:hypothetical protein
LKESLIDYNDMFFESATILMEVEGMSDEALLDECNHILSSNLESVQMDNVLIAYFKSGKLTPEDRRKAEGFYILAYADLVWED